MYIIVIVVLVILYFFLLYPYRECFKVVNRKQANFQKTLEDMADILNRHGIEYFLFCGTALGCHREGQFIEHDHDIDLGVFKNRVYLPDIIKIIEKYPDTFTLSRSFPSEASMDKITELTFKHLKTNIELDIFQVDNQGKHFYFYTYTDICDSKPNGRCEFKINPFNLMTTRFMDREYRIPPISYLKDYYGSSWNIPQKLSYRDIITKFSSP